MHAIHAPNHGRTPGDRQFIVVVIDMRQRMLEETFRIDLSGVAAAAGREPYGGRTGRWPPAPATGPNRCRRDLFTAPLTTVVDT
jgi:hypothetical protein